MACGLYICADSSGLPSGDIMPSPRGLASASGLASARGLAMGFIIGDMGYWAYATGVANIIVAMASLRANMVFSGFQENGQFRTRRRNGGARVAVECPTSGKVALKRGTPDSICPGWS